MNQTEQSALLALPLFEHLPITAFERLVEQGFIQSEPAEAVLFQEGNTAKFLHVILSGKVALVAAAASSVEDAKRPQQREAIIEIFSAGEVVIAPAVLLGLPYLMSARIIETARIAFLPAPAIRELLQESHDFAREAALMLARHWRLLARQLKNQKLRSAPQRLGRYLLTLTDGTDGDRVEVELALDRRTLASWLGMSPENLSRSIAQLNEVGVHVRGRLASIASISRLNNYCLGDDLQ